MRTTLRLDDDLVNDLKTLAARKKASLGEVTNQVLRLGLMRLEAPPGKRHRYREKVVDMGEPAVNLDKALALSASLEDAEAIRELQLRK